MANDLRNELLTDPLSPPRGYAAMSDQEAAADLNISYRTRDRSSMSGDEVFKSVASRTDWDGLTDTQRTQFLAFCGRDSIDPFAGANVELVKSIFGDASVTVSNLSAARVESITRAEELRDANSDFPVPVLPRHVTAARL